MALSTEDLYDKALTMSGNVEDNFLELGRSLRQLLARDPELFKQVVEKSDLGRRKAYYLVEVSAAFDPLKFSRTRLSKLGWSKLQILARHVKQDNIEELVKLAENATNRQLERLMAGEAPMKNARCVLLYFSPKQYDELETALLHHGGKRAGRGIVDKEKALISVVRKVLGGMGLQKHDEPVPELVHSEEDE